MTGPPTVIFLDTENIFYSLHNAFPGQRINITKLIFYLKEKFGDFRLYAFGHFSRSQGLPLFIRRNLDAFPFTYVFETKLDDATGASTNEADRAMFSAMMYKDIGIIANASRYKHVVIMSGDGCFFDVAITAQLLGMKVTVVPSCRDTVNHIYENAGPDIFYLEDDMARFHDPGAETDVVADAAASAPELNSGPGPEPADF